MPTLESNKTIHLKMLHIQLQIMGISFITQIIHWLYQNSTNTWASNSNEYVTIPDKIQWTSKILTQAGTMK